MTAGAKPYAAHAGFSAPETTEAESELFLAEHHAIRLIAAEPCAHLENVAYLLNILEIMPCEKGGFVGRSPENSARQETRETVLWETGARAFPQ